MENNSNKTFRWILRIVSSILILFFLFMFLGYKLTRDSNPMTTDAILQLSLTGLGLIGFIVAWKWELIGGIISLAAFIILGIINPTALMSPMMIFPLIAILFILLGIISINSTKIKEEVNEEN